MSRPMSKEVARDLQLRSARVKRTNSLVRIADAWVEQDAPRISELPESQRRVVDALLRAVRAAENAGDQR